MHHAKADAIEIDNFVLLVVHLGRTVQELGARRPQVRAAAGGCVIAATGRGGSRMKVFGFGEGLPDKAGGNNFAVYGHKAAISLFGKNELRNTGHDARIQESGEYCENQSQTKSRSKFFKHVFLPHARPSATMSLSIAQIPGNGTMIPPSP